MKHTKKRIVFLHLPKNGGTTLKSILGKVYTKGETFRVEYDKDGDWNIAEYEVLSEDEKDRIHLVSGHFNFGIHEHLAHPFRYMTMLRHPVERTISFYEYIKRQKEHRLLDAVNGKSMLECVTQVHDFDVVNGQARKISDVDDEAIMLRSALENIDRWFDYVGIQECYDESILMLNHKFGWNYSYYSRLNASKAGKRLDPELVHEIEKRNKVDMELYELMRERFMSELNGIRFLSTRLGMYRSLNRLASVWKSK